MMVVNAFSEKLGRFLYRFALFQPCSCSLFTKNWFFSGVRSAKRVPSDDCR